MFDKQGGLAAYRGLRRRLAGRRFDALLHMQLALRASLAAAVVPARVKLGFDRARAREAQWLFTTHRIDARSREHVLDSLFGFTDRLGIQRRSLRWDIPLPAPALAYARRVVPDDQPTLVLSPCSSHALRNWGAERYASLAKHAASRHGLRVLICGGPQPARTRVRSTHRAADAAAAASISWARTRCRNCSQRWRGRSCSSRPTPGRRTWPPRSERPVVGIYAATNPARSGPYCSREWCVNRYEEAAVRFLGKPASEIPWTTKIERPGVMDLVTVDDAAERLDALMAAGAPRTTPG